MNSMQTPIESVPPVKTQFLQKIIIAIGAFCLGLVVPLLGLYIRSTDGMPAGSKESNGSPEQTAVNNVAAGNAEDEVLEKFSFGNLAWIGRLVDSRTYQLVRVSDAVDEGVVFSHPRGFDFTEWTGYGSEMSNSGVMFTYNASPGEAFVDSTTIFFDENGEEVMRTTHMSPSGTMTIQKPGAALQTITLTTSESCPTDESGYNESTQRWQTGETTLLGIKMSSADGTSQTFNLSQPQTVPCGTAYGDTIIEPLISNLKTSPTGATFELPTGGHAWVSFDDASDKFKIGAY